MKCVHSVSSFKHSCVCVLCKIGLLNGKVYMLEFNWLILGGKFFIFNLAVLKNIALYLLGRRFVKAILPDELKILLRIKANDIQIVDEIYLEDLYHKEYKPQLGDVIFDVGSHIGAYTLRACRLVGPNGNIYAFEPEPGNFALLEKNITLNNMVNVKIFNSAVSSRKGMLRLHIHPTNTGMNSIQLKSGRTGSRFVSSVVLDEIMQEYHVQQVNLLKIDVEGHEFEVLRGANRFLCFCKHIAIETHERQGGPMNTQIVEILSGHGFNVRLVEYQKDNDVLYAWKP